MNKRLQHQIIFFLFFCLPGLVVLGFSIHLASSSISLVRSGQSETGVLVGYERQSKLRLGHRLCPVVEFPYNDTTVKFTDAWCNKTRAQFPEGTQLPVRFHANNPAAARIDDFASLFATSLITGVIAIPFLLLGVTLVIRTR